MRQTDVPPIICHEKNIFAATFFTGGLFFISGCASTPATTAPVNTSANATGPAQTDDTTGKACAKNSDCRLPMSYAVRSDWSYQAYCDQGKCAVACPLYFHSPIPEEGVSYPVACEKDADCDCTSQRDAKSYIRCACLGGQCAAVAAERPADTR